VHFENLLFILLGLAFVVLRWLVQRAADSTKDSQRDQPGPPTRAPAQSDEERVRRVMEALGNPVGSKPPPKVTPRPLQQARPISAETKRKELERQARPVRKAIWTAPLPPLTTTPPPEAASKRVTVPQPIAKPAVEQNTFRPFTPMPLAVAATQRPTLTTRQFDLPSLLASPDGLRNAVLLREILGPPRGLQPLDAV
jgi:hypothetical protein